MVATSGLQLLKKIRKNSQRVLTITLSSSIVFILFSILRVGGLKFLWTILAIFFTLILLPLCCWTKLSDIGVKLVENYNQRR